MLDKKAYLILFIGYGMSVTNNIRDEVEYDNEMGWSENPISNEEILKKLQEEEKTGFLSFAYGVW